MKKLAALLAVVMLASACFSGCSGNQQTSSAAPSQDQSTSANGATTDQPKDTPEVKVWIKKSFSEPADAALAARLEEYGKTTGKCNVVVEFIPNSNMTEKYSVAVESGEVPDVAYMTLFLLRQYYDAGLMLEVGDLVDSIEGKGHDFFQTAKDAATFDNELYAVPYYLTSNAMLYRTDYLQQAGWNEPPATWEDVRQCAIDVTNAVDGVYGLGFTYGKAPDTENNSRAALYSMGGHIFDEEGNVSLDDPDTLASLQWLCDLYTVDKCVPPTAVSWDDAGNNKAFLSGQVAMIFNAASLTMELQKDENKELAANSSVANMPSGKNGVKVCSGPQYLGIFKGAKNVELAKELIEYNMDYDWYKGWVDEMRYGLQPAYEEITYDDPYINPYIHANQNLAWQGYPGPYTGVAAKTWSSFALCDLFQSVLVDNKSVEEAAKTMAETIESLK